MKMMASYVARIIFNVTRVYPFINMISIIFTQMDGATTVHSEVDSSCGDRWPIKNEGYSCVRVMTEPFDNIIQHVQY